MGLLSFRSKPYFLGLLKCLNSFYCYIIFFSLINLSYCIYEDQIGKFDWRQNYVGRIKFAQFDTVSTAKRIIVATEENVLAALNLKTGQVVWRHVLETASSGNIQFLHVSERVLTVTGDNPYVVRGWDTATGVLLWEWSLALQDAEGADFSRWWVQHGLLVHLLPVYGSHLEVTMYNMVSGHNRGATSRLPAVWTKQGCVVTQPYYTCISGTHDSQLLLSLDVTSDAVQMISRPLSKYVDPEKFQGRLRPFDGASTLPGFILDDSKILLIKDNDYELLKFDVADKAGSVMVVESSNGPIVLQAWQDHTNVLSLSAHSTSTGQVEESVRATDQTDIPHPQLVTALCTRSAKEQFVCRILVNGEDDSLTLLQQGGRVLWNREEALANVEAVKFVDLPVSDLEAAIESEFDHKEGSIWGAFSRRITTQFQQLASLVHSWSRLEAAGEEEQAPLVRDYFNLHKMIVLITQAGKMFGIDNMSGALLWRRYLPLVEARGAALYLRRSARHPPHLARLTMVARHRDTGNGVIVSVDPITGQLVGERVLQLEYKLLQSAMLPAVDAEHLRALLLLDHSEDVQVFPTSSAPLISDMYMFVAERKTALVQGYAIQYDGKTVNAVKTWSINLGGTLDSGHTIVQIVPKSPDERVHSPGKVMGDRSVLYKYLNPNLVLFITEGPDPVHKDVVSAWCVDVVSGAPVFSQSHRRARATPHALHSDNFLAYVYYNDKQRRTEIATVELYAGRERWAAPDGGFSSLRAERGALAERQAFIVPATVTAAAVTATERALTDKHVLLSLSTGAVLQLPWAYLEPRRPLLSALTAGGATSPAEEGLLPYAPELPLPADAAITYNRTLLRVRRLHAAPAGLESTCLVLATGLDLFYTRVAPSKTFDLLKDDFDYYLISIVLVALVVATYSTKYFASRKMLKQGWK